MYISSSIELVNGCSVIIRPEVLNRLSGYKFRSFSVAEGRQIEITRRHYLNEHFYKCSVLLGMKTLFDQPVI